MSIPRSLAAMLCTAAIATSCVGHSVPAQPQQPRTVSFTASDGFILRGKLHGAPQSRAGVLAVHQCDRPRAAAVTGFEGIASLLAQHGLAVLVMDLRGYGQSVAAAGGTGGPAEPGRHLADVDAALGFLASHLALPRAS